MTTASSAFGPSLFRNLVRSPWLRPLNDVTAIDDLLGLVRPHWSISTIKARVVGSVRETSDARTLVLSPNALWPGHRAGQHVTLEVEINGRRLRRTFSLSSPPARDGLLSITVKRREGGKVSRWWNDAARVGDVLTLSRPAGDFVLPRMLPKRLVMISAGSGITPLMAMLRDLDAGERACQVLFVHCARSRSDLIFAAELAAIAKRRPWLDLRLHLTSQCGRLDAVAWRGLAGEAGDAPVYLCGPVDFMADVRQAWGETGAKLHTESFGISVRPACDDTSSQAVTAARSSRTFAAGQTQTLLDAAEQAGLRPAYGCRAGVCHTCKCRKLSGVVEDLRDGRISSEPGEMIQLCVTAARSPVELEL